MYFEGVVSWSNGCSIGLWHQRTRDRIQPPLVILLLMNHIFIWRVNKAFSRKWREEERRGRKDVWKRARKAHEQRRSGDTKRSQLPRWKKKSRSQSGGKEDVQQDKFVRIRKARWREHCSNSHGKSSHRIQNTECIVTEYNECKESSKKYLQVYIC